MSTSQQIEADIERQREQLAQTVDELGRRMDVKSRLKPRPGLLGVAAGLVLVTGVLVLRRRRR